MIWPSGKGLRIVRRESGQQTGPIGDILTDENGNQWKTVEFCDCGTATVSNACGIIRDGRIYSS